MDARRYRLLLEHLPQTAIVVFDHDLRLELVTGPALQDAGLQAGDVEGRLLEDVVPATTARVLARHYRRALAGECVSLEYRSTLDGRSFWLQVVPLLSDEGEGEVTGAMAITLDITERTRVQEELRRSEERFRKAFDEAPIGMALLGLDGRLQKVNSSLCEITGQGAGELVGMSLSALADPPDPRRDIDRLGRLMRGEVETHGAEMPLRHVSGLPIETALRAVLLRDAAGQPEHVLLQIQDITERKHVEDGLQFLADHDPLTGVLNRRGFERELERHLAGLKHRCVDDALLVVDLDHFKRINDTLGHEAGDELISRVTTALRGRLRARDVLGRLGGDEFAVLLGHVTARQAATVADALLAVVRNEQVGPSPKRAGQITASAGVTMLDDPRCSCAEILSRADRAMYYAKQRGRDRYAFSGSAGCGAPPLWGASRLAPRRSTMEGLSAGTTDSGEVKQMKEFSCGAVVPGCDAHFSAATEEEILGQVQVHAADAHGLTEVPPEVADQVRANIHDAPSAGSA